MRIRSILTGLVAVAILAPTISAQEEEEAPKQAYSIITLVKEPGTMLAWRSAIERMVAAAKSAELSAADYGWWTWHNGDETMIGWPVPQDELFHQNKIFEAIAEADSAEAAAIGEMFEAAPARTVSTEIIELDTDLSYTPAYPIEGSPSGAQIFDMTIAPDQGEAFEESVKAYVALLGELNSPYAMSTYRVRYGQQRIQMVTFFDNRENYFGPNDLSKLVQAKPELAEKLGEAYSMFLESISTIDSQLWRYDVEASFPPTP